MEVLNQKLLAYYAKAKPSFDSIEVVEPSGEKVKDTAFRYFSDSKHFMDSGEYVNAFAALEYAEGWLDAGVAMGVVKAKNKDKKSI
jgi:uncharacterized protein